MSRHLISRSLAALAAALALGAFGLPKQGEAQSVTPPSSNAQCIQNAGNGDFACGSGSAATPGTGNTAVGINAKATADATTAYGAGANASSIAAIAIGQGAAASQQGSVAMGQGAVSSGNASTALGFAARALGNDSIAIGDVATAQGQNSIAIGGNTSANFAASAAIGIGAQTTAANQMVLGTATSIYQLPGVNSAASKAAQKGPVKMLTVDANGNVAVADIPTCRCPPVVPPKKKN